MSVFNLFAASCDGGGLLGFPHWYKYLDGKIDPVTGACAPQMTGLTDVWLIVAAVIEILLRIATLVAIFAIIYGGFQYMTSQGTPDQTNKARETITNGLIGLVIAILASGIIGFIAGSIK